MFFFLQLLVKHPYTVTLTDAQRSGLNGKNWFPIVVFVPCFFFFFFFFYQKSLQVGKFSTKLAIFLLFAERCCFSVVTLKNSKYIYPNFFFSYNSHIILVRYSVFCHQTIQAAFLPHLLLFELHNKLSIPS